VPEQASDVTYVTVVDGLPPDAAPLTVVLVRRRSWRAALSALFGGREVAVGEAEAAVTPVLTEPERRDG
jgi:hypothetical protein